MEEEKKEKIKSEVLEAEKKSRQAIDWKLPEKIGKKEVFYYQKMDNRGIILMGMAVLTGSLLYIMEKQNQLKKQEEKRREMMLDYPEIINKMTLFLGAGMTVKRAWKRIVDDYENQREEYGKRYVYEEMKQAIYEMEGGVTEAKSYENFGRRCNMQVYIRFGALLSQNMRKGTKGLTKLLKMESIQAFEERKARAKKLGEEAGTKLLLPMFIMLIIVLVIVIIPAFLSMQV